MFAPQPPVFYLLLRLISALGADSVAGFHWGMVAVAVATSLAAYALVRSLAGVSSAFAAAALLTVAPPFPLFAHRVLADVPPLLFALISLWLAWLSQERRSAWLGGAAGAMLLLAVCTKPNAILALVPFVWLLCWDRGWWRRGLTAAVGGAILSAALLLYAYRDVIGELWASVVVYHRDARDTPELFDRWDALLTFLNWRTPYAWAVVAGLTASVVLLRRRLATPVWALWLWAAVTLAFLAYYRPLHDNHFVALAVVLALPAGMALGALIERVRWRNLAVVALLALLAAGYLQQLRRAVLDDTPEEPELVRAAAILQRETKPGDHVVSDHPIVPFLANRPVAGPLVDTAVLRFETGSLDDAAVVDAIEQWNVSVVVIGRALRDRPGVVRHLRSEFRALASEGDVTVYRRLGR